MAPFLLRCPRPGGLSPYAARVHPAASTRRTPPAPAIAAAVLALLSAVVPTFFAPLIALTFSGGAVGDGGWLVILVPVVLLLALPVGAVLLLLGRSWLALALPAGAVTAVLLAGYVMGGRAAGASGALVLVAPLITTVLAAMPRVRGWVAARRAARTSP